MDYLKYSESFLALVCLGIGHTDDVDITNVPHREEDWNALKTLAVEQGLSAVILNALDTDCTNLADSIPLDLKLEWIGEILQDYRQRCEQYKQAIAELAKLYNKHGYRMMVLKGYACSLDWPNPEHRPCGDIDIWLFGNHKEADKVLSNTNDTNKIEIDNSHHHHTVFEWKGFTVEDHYDFINVHHHKTNAEIEKILKELGRDDSCFVELYGEKVYLPSANLHALFLLKHAMMHFAAEGITLRQLLDWGFFVQNHTKEVDWKWLDGVLEKYGMKPLFNIFNAICVEDLGFGTSVFPSFLFEPGLKERVLNEILSPKFSEELPKNLIRRMVLKYRRWKDSAWKHELCYKESMWSAFWSGIWNHLLKPSSI